MSLSRSLPLLVVLLLVVLLASVAHGALFGKINDLMSQITAKYPQPPACKWQLGPDTCPAYGRPFTGIDGSTECTACTLTCANINLFKKNGKTTCQKPYYNYGCHKKFHCVDETAKFHGQYKAAIAFCMLYNGCTLTSKNDATTLKQIDQVTAPRSKAFVAALESLDVEPEFEDLRAFILQLLPSQFLLRFKLVQDIVDAQFKNETLASFLMRHPITRVPLPGFITGQISTTNYLVETIYLWHLVKTVPAENLAEAKLTEQVQQIALQVQELKRKAVNINKEAKKIVKEKVNANIKNIGAMLVGTVAAIDGAQKANASNSEALNTARNRVLFVTCNYIKFIRDADEQFSKLFGEAKWQSEFAGKKIEVGELALPVIGKQAVTLIYPAWKVLIEGNNYFNNPSRAMTMAERLLFIATSMQCSSDQQRMASKQAAIASSSGSINKQAAKIKKLVNARK